MLAVRGVDGAEDVELHLVLLHQPGRPTTLSKTEPPPCRGGRRRAARAGRPGSGPRGSRSRGGTRTTRHRAGRRWSGACSRCACPARAYFFSTATARRKKSSPMSVGSPPCQAMVTSGHLVRLDGLADVALHHLVGHAERAVRVQLLLLQEEAVVAVQVAARPGGLGHDVEGLKRLRVGIHGYDSTWQSEVSGADAPDSSAPPPCGG